MPSNEKTTLQHFIFIFIDKQVWWNLEWINKNSYLIPLCEILFPNSFLLEQGFVFREKQKMNINLVIISYTIV